MKIAIGMIVRNLISAHPLTDFLDNAEKYDHPIERVIVVYSHEADSEAIQELQRKAKVSLIRLQNYERAHMQRIVVKPSANKPCTISEMRRSLRITERQPTAPTIGIA